MLDVKKTEEWAFFFIFFGGILLAVNAIIGLILVIGIGVVPLVHESFFFLDGLGLFVFVDEIWADILGGILNILVGLIGLICGLKLFLKPFFNFITKIDVAIIGLFMIFVGILTFTLPGLLLTVGGIYCFIYRLTVDGAKNPKAK